MSSPTPEVTDTGEDELAGPPSAFDAYVERVAPDTLAVTAWLDPPADTQLSDRFVVRMDGRLRAASEEGSASGSGAVRFEHEESVEGLIGGCGPVAVTARVTGIRAGEWEVSADTAMRIGDGRSARRVEARLARWSWTRWSPVADVGAFSARSCRLPFAMAPGTAFGVWPAMAIIGIALALFVQGWLSGVRRLGLAHLLPVSVAAVAGGLVGAKLWYLMVHRAARRRDGWCIQGLVAGVTVVGALLVALTGLPVGRFLDATAPALLFGMAVGRIGCFFGGCCYGRPTSSRLGIWSSDRHVGVRRIPTQLMESLLAASLGGAAVAGLLAEPVPRGGVFLAALGAYTLLRQRLLAWRAEQRQTSWLTVAASVAAGLALAGGTVLAWI